MEPADYKHWARLQKEIETKRNKSGHREIRVKTEEEEALEEQLFEAVSKRAWTDILLQLLKVYEMQLLYSSCIQSSNSWDQMLLLHMPMKYFIQH